MCAIVAYWRGKRQVRFVKLENSEAICVDLCKRGFTMIKIMEV